MKYESKTIVVSSSEPVELVDITDQVRAFVQTQSLKNGLLNLFTQHTTATVNINESCAALEEDLKDFLQKAADPKLDYKHNKVCVDDRPNAHSHLLNFMMNNTPTIPIHHGELILGKWQRIFFIELDGPREKREVTLTFTGE